MTPRHLKIVVQALRVTRRHRLRSALLMLMAALGVDGIVCSFNYGAGGTKQILDQIRGMGTNVLIITPAQSRPIAGRERTGNAVTTLVERDHIAIRKTLLARTRSSAVVSANFWTKAGDFSKNPTITGVEPDYFTIRNWPVATGALFDDTDERTAGRVALLGHTVALDLFGSTSIAGQHLMINRVPFVVAGVLAERGQGLDISNEDSQIFVPVTTAMRRLMNTDHYSAIVIEIDSMNSMSGAAEELRTLLQNLHRIPPNQPDDFQIQNQKTLVDTQLAAASRLNFFLRWIAASALTVSGLGIVATIWITVKERTREIGTRRALGATRSDIFLQVLLEAAALAGAGAVVGVAVSWPASQLINKSGGLPFAFENRVVVFSLAATLTLNLAFSILPSRKAASVSPLEALRYE